MSSSDSIQRVYVEKRAGFDIEAQGLRHELSAFLGASWPEIASLAAVRILNRYDAAHLDRAQFETACRTVFAEPQCDSYHIQADLPKADGTWAALAVEYLPGQYDQRSDSAEQCVELVVGTRPRIRTARVYLFAGEKPLPDGAIAAIRNYLINPVDSREASLALPDSLDPAVHAVPDVPTLAGFMKASDADLATMARGYGLAMALEDLQFCRAHFQSIGRDPSLAELRVLDTYWSDHCRHSTFTTVLKDIAVADGGDAEAVKKALELYEAARVEVYGEAGAQKRPRTLMDLATIGGKLLRKRGQLDDLEVSEEINACSVHVEAEFEDGTKEPWLLMFKNETHNHPTEIEPYGGAATCLGGAIRDPLSGRSWVHQAMRVSGGGDPRVSLGQTLEGKLPQLKIAREAAAGYAGYGNQIGLATGQVSEFYHPGFLAKRMELGAVIAAVPTAWVRREEPKAGDLVILLGGKTGRDGIGGATGSSKEHTEESVQTAGAEVQKGNAVEERKIQRLFRNPDVTRLIKRCNDFGAGGVSVAVGELARGLEIDLDAVPRKYEGLDGVELAISESQERMAVVIAPEDEKQFIALSAAENLCAVRVAVVTGEERLRMNWRGATIVDLDRSFLDSNGASRSTSAHVVPETSGDKRGGHPAGAAIPNASVTLDNLERELRSLRTGSRRGLQERFDGSIGAASVLFPWGGAEQGTPECGMAAKLPSLGRDAATASLMSFGYNPELASQSPFRGARAAILEALAKFACLGGDPFSARLSLQEYFERMNSGEAWGKPLAALLAALEAQVELGVPAIGGKDSMSGTYRDPANGRELRVPPTLVAFAAGVAPSSAVRGGALSGRSGNQILLFTVDPGRPFESFRANVAALEALSDQGLVCAAYPVVHGGVAASLALMSFGNMVGVEFDASSERALAEAGAETSGAGAFLVELDAAKLSGNQLEVSLRDCTLWANIAVTIDETIFRAVDPEAVDPAMTDEENAELSVAETKLAVLRRAFEYPLATVYPQTSTDATVAETPDSEPLALPSWTKGTAPRVGNREKGKPLVILPAFPGTNCEYDMERAFRKAGARTEILVFRNQTKDEVRESTARMAKAISGAQILAVSGGFSAGDEPEGSGKFIANALRAAEVQAAVTDLLKNRDGLSIGICNGFQALIKLGLVPYGEFREADETLPTLTFNRIGRHVSRMVRTRVMSNQSPWLALDPVGMLHVIPVSHGEGRIAIRDALARELFSNGQVPFCYADASGEPTMAEPDNPNGSAFAIEGLTSPDGRVLGKMGHSERVGENVHKNIAGNKYQRLFEAGVRYFL